MRRAAGAPTVSQPRSTARRTLRVTRRYAAAPSDVFAAWLDAAVARRWLFATATQPMTDVRMEPRVGGAFHLAETPAATPHTGRYLEIEPDRRLVFTLTGPMHARATARVCVEVTPRGRGSALTVTHRDVPSADAERARDRWTGILYGLEETLRN
ncbi:MAG TPA: SRPBCC domain-containing protein [Casimicrobiaceae bacterium]|nr:SRPBCC domain-containing protein [Casimicrobiaceae bacterium]